MSVVVLRGIKYGVSAALVFLVSVGTLGCMTDVVAPMNTDECFDQDGQTYCESSGGDQPEGDCIWIDGRLYCKTN